MTDTTRGLEGFDPVSVGTELAQAREHAGMTVAQVSDLTMIRRTLIETIEADDFHLCGGDVYARGHIRAIAHAVGLDAEPLIAEYDREHVPAVVPTASGVLDRGGPDDAALLRSAERRRPNWTAAMAVALAGVAAVAAFQLLSGGGGGTPTDVAGGAPVSPTARASDTAAAPDDTATDEPNSAPSESATPSSAPSDAIAAVPGQGVTVVLKTNDGKSWVSATGKDSGVLYQSVVGAGREQTFRDDKQVKLVIGNAGVVSLVVNGRDLGSPGGEGEVVRLSFGPGDPTVAGG